QLCPPQVRLTWHDNSANEDRFEIEVQVDNSGTWGNTGTAPANTQQWLSPLLSPGHSYSYRLRSCASNDCSQWSLTPVLDFPAITVTGKVTGTFRDLQSLTTDPALQDLPGTRLRLQIG